MFLRKLQSLEYNQPFNFEDENDFRNLIFWLENMKIRFYPIESRHCIAVDSSTWQESFNKYLNEIGFSGKLDDRKFILDWLLNLALRYEMEDLREQMQMSRKEINDLSSMDNTNNLSAIDVNSPQFVSELRNLSKVLNVPFYDDEPLVTLKAIAILLRKMKQSNLKDFNQAHESVVKKKKLIKQADETILNMPFSSHSKYDPMLNRASNVLRLLYINDLRELQTQVNQILVQVQSITANPKTDTALGKVGR